MEDDLKVVHDVAIAIVRLTEVMHDDQQLAAKRPARQPHLRPSELHAAPRHSNEPDTYSEDRGEPGRGASCQADPMGSAG
jgi:hypothetical protein